MILHRKKPQSLWQALFAATARSLRCILCTALHEIIAIYFATGEW
jgi:hypothetical protein